IFFTYLPAEKKVKREELNSLAFEVIKTELPTDWIADVLQKVPTKSNGDRTLLEKHINDFTARNTFDYFIHKDLGGFLRRELDFYIKNEVLHIDDINTNDAKDFTRQLTKIKALKVIAQKVITFLEQIENFQKRLWLKKKFVVETNYCITLDKIPDSYYPEIAENEAQWEEWEQLFTLSELPKDLFHGGPAADRLTILQQQPFLVLDTRFFSEDFKNRLIAEFKDLDAEMDGLLVNSENFQALELLQKSHKGQIKCIYIDPPYNAKSSEILYKNTFKHASWLSFMDNRILLGKMFLTKESGVNIVAIDENEQERLGELLSSIFPNEIFEKVCVTIIHNPGGIQGDNFSYTHEYAYFLYPRGGKKIGLETRDQKNADIRPLRDVSTGNHLRIDAANCFYPILVKDETVIGFGDVCPDEYHPDSINVLREDGIIEIYPIDAQGNERKWVFARQTVESIKSELSVEFNRKRKVWDIIRTKVKFNFKTVWLDKKYSANSYGSKLLNNIIGDRRFSFPKSINTTKDSIDAGLQNQNNGTILDYFAGSGTTAHAVINLNREDGGTRKYILVEMGEYFHTVTKPRIQKVIYSEDWKDGKPVSRKGSSHLFKYIRLESYEDTLNNLRVVRKEQQQNVLELNDTFYEEYLLGYMLDTETSDSLLSIQDFADPFNYQLTITENNEPKPTVVDMVETFNYLIGLKVATLKTIDGFRVVTGTRRTGEPTLVIWRNTAEKDDTALRTFFTQYMEEHPHGSGSPLQIYINGDNSVASLGKETDNWSIHLTEQAFLQQMFSAQDV
ncbi:MAG: site-specific DNA-methyltransferase, partial [Bacteroidota bacterium]